MHLIRLCMTIIILSLLLTLQLLAATPRLAVDQPTFNFGAVPQGKKVDHVFTFTNKGDAPLTIEQVRTSCGCTAANTAARLIEPGKKGEIKVTFDSTNYAGTISKTVFVHSNDPQVPIYSLILQGTVSEEIAVTPRQLNLGTIKAGGTGEAVLTIENRSDKPVALKSVRTTNPKLGATLSKNLLKPGESGKVSVTATPGAEDRSLNGYIFIATDHPAKPEISIPVFAVLSR